MKENIHKGHRQRVRERYLQEGGDSFADHELLELILFSCIPMKDTNELAHLLLKEFGSLSLLIEAKPQDIVKRCGVSMNTAIFIAVQKDLIRRAIQGKWEKRPILNSSQKAGEFAVMLLSQLNHERFYVICLDNRHKFIYSAIVAEGTVREAVVYPRLVVEAALRHQASAVILAHNHPGGSLRPSFQDISTTANLVKAFNLIDIMVMDHIIVADNKYFSFAETGMIQNNQEK